jgi:hypothetical protein
MDDPRAGERFIRVVGKRMRPAAGEIPSATARTALAAMANYRTRTPKGVFVYASHEAANHAREAWTIQAIVDQAE